MFKEQILKKCIETNKYNVVAMKHNLPVTTVYTGIKRDKHKTRMHKILKEFSNGGGYQKLTWYPKRDYNYRVNSKKIYWLYRENDFLLPKKKKRKKARVFYDIWTGLFGND